MSIHHHWRGPSPPRFSILGRHIAAMSGLLAEQHARVCGLHSVPACRPLAVPCSRKADSHLRFSTCITAVKREGSTLELEQTSLIPETLEEMAADTQQLQLAEMLARRGQAAMTREERRKRQRSLEAVGAPSFSALSKEHCAKPLQREPASILQLNIGLYCNQACSHCHVESSPLRTEMMDRATAERCLELLREPGSTVRTVDITGGAPELNAQFRFIVENVRKLGLEVIDRCNLTVLLEPSQGDLVDFLARNQVRVVASLPCYSAKNVEEQRGSGVFDRSIKGLKLLNAAGYGRPDTGLVLDLVYNPNGTFLAPPQAQLEEAYKQELEEVFGITFNSLFCLNNMPIKRYADYLVRRDELQSYMQLLVSNFNAAAANGVMCRDTVSIAWDGQIYDCDFNQQLELHMRLPQHLGGAQPSVFSINSLSELTGVDIACDNHCFGCTAGSGSSCQGATLED